MGGYEVIFDDDMEYSIRQLRMSIAIGSTISILNDYIKRNRYFVLKSVIMTILIILGINSIVLLLGNGLISMLISCAISITTSFSYQFRYYKRNIKKLNMARDILDEALDIEKKSEYTSFDLEYLMQRMTILYNME